MFGSEGNLSLGGLNSTELILSTKERGIAKPYTFQTHGRIPHFMYRFADAYLRELEAFVRCLVDGRLPEVDQNDALRAYKVALAATDAAGTGRPIRLA